MMSKLFYTRPDCTVHMGVFAKPQCLRVGIASSAECMHGLRALFVSDVHLRPSVREDQLAALVELMAAQQADMLFLGGDYAETADDCIRFFRALSALQFPLGAYAVPGNNDLHSAETLAEIANRAGIHLLNNATYALDLLSGRLAIAGCDDHKYGAPRTKDLFSETDADYRILLSHFPVLPDCRCNLMLCGHTHAGQCNLLGLTPYSFGFEHRFQLCGVRGYTLLGDMRMLIGNGIGISRFPLRLGAQPQIYLLEFGEKDFLEKPVVKS